MKIKQLLKDIEFYRSTLDIKEKKAFNVFLSLFIKNMSNTEKNKYYAILQNILDNTTYFLSLNNFNKKEISMRKIKGAIKNG